ncbi:MAG TPA: hypothetical protein VGG90_11795 [Candidatus Dormibacteraeota bacterium]
MNASWGTRLAALSLLTFMAGACGGSPQPVAAKPSPTPLPPGHTAFFYSTAPDAPVKPVGWDGSTYASFGLGGLTGGPGIQSPDGSKLLVGDAVFDRATGAVTQLGTVAGKGLQVMWADDSRHLCLLHPAGSSEQAGGTTSVLELLEPGMPAKTVAKVGHDEAQAFALLRSCSVTNDIAVVAQRAVLPISDVWAIRISTGEVVQHLAYAQGQQPGAVVVASDGRWMAEVTTSTSVVDLSSGAAVGHLDGAAVAFSSNGRVLVMEDRVVDWTTNRKLWSSPAGFSAAFVAGEPSTSTVAVDVMTGQGSAGQAPLSQLWLVADSFVKHIADGAVPSFVTVN